MWKGWESYVPPRLAAHGSRITAQVAKGNKFNARARVYNGQNFGSSKELRRWQELEHLQAAGEISQLTPHPCYELEVNGIRVGRYTADASYITKDGEFVIEETKSPATQRETSYRLRKKLFEACHWPLTVTER